MERKTKIEIVLAIAVIITLLLLTWWWTRRADPVVETTKTTTAAMVNSKNKPTGSTTAPTTQTSPIDPTIQQTAAIIVARTFVERLGSYSSETNATNITDVMSMATQTFQKQLETLAKQLRSSSTDKFYGVSTLVITAPKTVTSTDTTITLSMTTQRQETIDSPGNTAIKYQSITVSLVKSGTTWLVDDYTWKEGI